MLSYEPIALEPGQRQRVADACGHRVVTDTAVDIADQVQAWFESGAAAGFNIMPPYLPGGLLDFVAQVVPQWQQRGVFRRRYSGNTPGPDPFEGGCPAWLNTGPRNCHCGNGCIGGRSSDTA